MARRSTQSSPEALQKKLVELLSNFESRLEDDDLRQQVLALIPVYQALRDLGSSLIREDIPAARDRILHYLRRYPFTVISGDELMVVAGIGEWARRLRELRVQFGWSVVSGYTAMEMKNVGDDLFEGLLVENMAPDEYMLISESQDREAALRWNVANEIRRQKGVGTKEKLLAFLRKNVGSAVSGEELRYVTNNKSEWARRVRELRTEEGWPVVTKSTGMPELPVGVYMLELDRQAPRHDRKISDHVRRRVLKRDSYCCQHKECSWRVEDYNRADPRILELHHRKYHAKGGGNTEDNLVALCNVCHDRVHAGTLSLD